MDLTTLTDSEVLGIWSDAMAELKRRGVIRSSNSPVADYAERLVAERLGLALVGQSMAAYDAVGSDGTRYQIKARRLPSNRFDRPLGAIRNLDQGGFDFLVIVLLGERFEMKGMWQLPIDLVREHARFRKHVNAHILRPSAAVLGDPRAIQLA